jgi:membrane-associated phospholipid phosphatase
VASRFKLPTWLALQSWQGRLFWLVVLIGPVWLLDKPLYDLQLHDHKFFLIRDFRDATRQFGEPVALAWIGAVLWHLDRSRRRPLMVALVATAIAWGIASGTGLLVGRQRPRVSDGRTIVQGPHWPGTVQRGSSFPASHTTVAFAFAFSLGRLYVQHRALWLALAMASAVAGAFAESYFLTDLLVGAWLGWEVSRLVWYSSVARLLMSRLHGRIANAQWLPRWDWGCSAGML